MTPRELVELRELAQEIRTAVIANWDEERRLRALWADTLSSLGAGGKCYNCGPGPLTETRWLCARCRELYTFNEDGAMVVKK